MCSHLTLNSSTYLEKIPKNPYIICKSYCLTFQIENSNYYSFHKNRNLGHKKTKYKKYQDQLKKKLWPLIFNILPEMKNNQSLSGSSFLNKNNPT